MPPALSSFALPEVTLKATAPPEHPPEPLPRQPSMPGGCWSGQGGDGPPFPPHVVCYLWVNNSLL